MKKKLHFFFFLNMSVICLKYAQSIRKKGENTTYKNIKKSITKPKLKYTSEINKTVQLLMSSTRLQKKVQQNALEQWQGLGPS
jgi:hypothetical protein